MAYSEKFTCDICGVERTASNHRFLASTTSTYIKTVEALLIYQFNHEDARLANYTSLCGASCVSKWVSENLSSLYPPAATPPVVESARPSENIND